MTTLGYFLSCEEFHPDGLARPFEPSPPASNCSGFPTTSIRGMTSKATVRSYGR